MSTTPLPFSRVLVVGATGVLGRPLVRALAARGVQVRALVRRPVTVEGAAETVVGTLDDAASLAAACAGCDAVFSAAGASLALALRPFSPGFDAVDRAGNLRLIAAAEAAGVRRFGYASVFHTPAQADTAYVRAHTAVEAALAASPLESVVVRPTGLFPAFFPLLSMARLGAAPLLGGPSARSNPLDAAELADLCADVLLVSHPGLVEVGGPEILSRGEAFEHAFSVLGKKPRFVRMPAAFLAAQSLLIRPLDRRLSDLLRFFVRVSTTDCVAPAHGTRRLADAFREAAQRG